MYLITCGPEEGTYSISISEDDDTHCSTSDQFDPMAYLLKSSSNNLSHVEFPDLKSLGITTIEDKPVAETTEPLVDTAEVPGGIELENTILSDGYICLNESETEQANQSYIQYSDPPVGLFIITDIEGKVFCIPNTDINLHSDLMGSTIKRNESQNECVENIGINENVSIETDRSTNIDIYPYGNGNVIEEYNKNSQNTISEHSIRIDTPKLVELDNNEQPEIADKLREIIAEVETKANEEFCLQELLESVEPFIESENETANVLDRNNNAERTIASAVSDQWELPSDPSAFTDRESDNTDLAVISDLTPTDFINLAMISDFSVTNVIDSAPVSDFIAINAMDSATVSDFTATNDMDSATVSDFTATNDMDSAPDSDFIAINAMNSATVNDFITIDAMDSAPISDFIAMNPMDSAIVSDFTDINTMDSVPVTNFTVTNEIVSAPVSDFTVTNDMDAAPVSDFTAINAIDSVPVSVCDATTTNAIALDPSSDSTATEDFQNKLLFALIAEFTDQLETQDNSTPGDCDRDNQNSELSILVADTIKKMETKDEKNETVIKSVSNTPANFSGIVAVDIGLTSIYLSSVGQIKQKAIILNKAVKKNGVTVKNDGVAVKKDGIAAKKDGVAVKKGGVTVKKGGVTVKKDGIAVKKYGVPVKKDGIDEKGKFICHHCHSAWSDFYMIKSHIVWNHIPEIEKKQIYRILPNMSNITLINRIFNKFHVLKKIRKKQKMKCSPFKLRVMFSKRKIKYYKCRKCDFKSPKEYDLRKHKSLMHNKPLYKCNDCTYSTVTQSCLARHVMARHAKEKPHQCKFCYYSSTQPNTLREHIMAKHKFTKPHECPYCNYSCVQKNQLNDHIKCKHTREKNRRCSYPNCNYIGTSSATVRRHIMARHTNERPYMCEYCTYSATQSGQLRKHIMAIHTKEKPFQCPFCSYEATQSYSLKIHIRRMHSINKEFQCNECEYTSSTSTYLKYHIQKKHQAVSQKDCVLPHGYL